MFDDLKDQYLDDIRSMLPLHRIVVFGVGFICSLTINNLTHKSLIETLLNLKISSLSFDSDGLFETALMGHLVLGVLLAFGAWCANALLTQNFFAWTLKKLNAKKRIEAELQRISESFAKSKSPPNEKLSYFSSQSSSAGKRVRRFANFGELCLGMCFCFAVGSYWGNALDALSALGFFVAFVFSTFVAIHSFFSKYLKYDLLSKAIAGDRASFALPDVSQT